jgi:hypothetical protein
VLRANEPEPRRQPRRDGDRGDRRERRPGGGGGGRSPQHQSYGGGGGGLQQAPPPADLPKPVTAAPVSSGPMVPPIAQPTPAWKSETPAATGGGDEPKTAPPTEGSES